MEACLLRTEASELAYKRELESIQVKLSREQESHEQTVKELLSKLEKLHKKLSETTARADRTIKRMWEKCSDPYAALLTYYYYTP